MKKIIYTIVALASVSGFAAENDSKSICDTAIIGKDVAAPEKCSSWLNQATSGEVIEGKAVANLDYADALMLADRTDEANTFYQKAYDYSIKTGKVLAIATTSEALARYYYHKKQYSKTLKFLEIAIKNNTLTFGVNNLITVNAIALQADVKRLEKDYQGALVDANLALSLIPKGMNSKLKVVPNLYNIRALSTEKLGHFKEAFSDYLQAAQLMEKFNATESIIIWKNFRAALQDHGITENLSLTEERIQFLADIENNSQSGMNKQLSPNVSLTFNDSSVKQ